MPIFNPPNSARKTFLKGALATLLLLSFSTTAIAQDESTSALGLAEVIKIYSEQIRQFVARVRTHYDQQATEALQDNAQQEKRDTAREEQRKLEHELKLEETIKKEQAKKDAAQALWRANLNKYCFNYYEEQRIKRAHEKKLIEEGKNQQCEGVNSGHQPGTLTLWDLSTVEAKDGRCRNLEEDLRCYAKRTVSVQSMKDQDAQAWKHARGNPNAHWEGTDAWARAMIIGMDEDPTWGPFVKFHGAQRLFDKLQGPALQKNIKDLCLESYPKGGKALNDCIGDLQEKFVSRGK